MKNLIVLLFVAFCQLSCSSSDKKTHHNGLLIDLQEEQNRLEDVRNSAGFWDGLYQRGKIPIYSHYEDLVHTLEFNKALERVNKGIGSDTDKKWVDLRLEISTHQWLKNDNENYAFGKQVRHFLEILIVFLFIYGLVKLLKRKKI